MAIGNRKTKNIHITSDEHSEHGICGSFTNVSTFWCAVAFWPGPKYENANEMCTICGKIFDVQIGCRSLQAKSTTKNVINSSTRYLEFKVKTEYVLPSFSGHTGSGE